MANSRDSAANYEYATVDTDPGAVGYYTNEIDVRLKQKNAKLSKMYFSIREEDADLSTTPSTASVVSVDLQFKCPGDAGWTTYVPLGGETLAIGNRLLVEDFGAGVLWRAGVGNDGYTSGGVRFGFDW